MIVRSAHRVNHGEFPVVVSEEKWVDHNSVLVEEQDVEALAQRVVHLVTDGLPGRGWQQREVQVIAPIYRGAAGVSRLNDLLQERLNPPSPLKAEMRRAGRLMRSATACCSS